ncbi:glycosyltransferase [Thalassobellus suaedae]|uniref:Glycosyltransferase n=1 Tax=Thalassobellus suaedae TaxID=3074124 RepID=A0ABY9Y0L5_9FLAO|nr:glycosyltransferase [Flavobacteriaceae bacterium HL-DH10]
MDVSIIIINYNTDALTLQAVASVFKYVKNIDFEVIVLENNSKVTCLDVELAKYENTYFYQLDENIGFGKANNYGFEKSKGDFIFLLNSDAYLINENAIINFIDYLKAHPKVACVGGNLIDDNGKHNISYGNFLSIEKLLFDYGLKQGTEDYYYDKLATSKYCKMHVSVPVDYLTGAAIVIKREVIETYGLFNPSYFMYLEDMELGFRYKKRDY